MHDEYIIKPRERERESSVKSLAGELVFLLFNYLYDEIKAQFLCMQWLRVVCDYTQNVCTLSSLMMAHTSIG